ncbi:DMT family transporter [Ferrimicrobium sp.]|uniref:DMT family transporter n=1 Tax=Ferrimicrobium sp. TaxID=2926050 RepID=UPI00262DEF0D|nr:DMT family transporter [Ferrimicrobium sp.]
MVVLLSLLAAVCFGMAAVLQFQASTASASELNLRFSLLWRLLANPRFGLGALFDVVGGLSQFFALKYGSVPQVLPILASGFVLAILLEHFLARRPIGVGDLIALLVSCGALITFLVLSPQASGRTIYVDASIVIGSLGIVIGVLTVTLLRPLLAGHGRMQAMIGALLLGVVSIFEREVGIIWTEQGAPRTLEHWELWVLVIVGGLALLVVQSAFQQQSLARVLPLVTVGEPIAAIAISTVALQTPLFRGGSSAIESLGALAVEILALIYLARSEVRVDAELHHDGQ